MEFNFDVKSYLKNDITKIEPRLIPEGFSGDRREVQECISRMSLIITTLGESSAKAQGLQRVITSGERLRNSDHTVYILSEGGTRNGTVLGMLKVGAKHLYVFDGKGNSHEVSAMCILDFYVHEAMQRRGLGKKLFEHMLHDKGVVPEHLAIDKPSPKFLSFLKKHYGLETIIPQMNNFVLFEGFFADRPSGDRKEFKDTMAAGISSSILRSAGGEFGRTHVYATESKPSSSPSFSVTQPEFGRYSAHRPVSTMGMILQQHAPSLEPSPGASRTNNIMAEIVTSPDPEESLEAAVEELHLEPDQDTQEEVVEVVAQAVEEEKLEEALEPAEVVVPVEPIPCKVQAAHLDLKFYHSSLW